MIQLQPGQWNEKRKKPFPLALTLSQIEPSNGWMTEIRICARNKFNS